MRVETLPVDGEPLGSKEPVVVRLRGKDVPSLPCSTRPPPPSDHPAAAGRAPLLVAARAQRAANVPLVFGGPPLAGLAFTSVSSSTTARGIALRIARSNWMRAGDATERWAVQELIDAFEPPAPEQD